MRQRTAIVLQNHPGLSGLTSACLSDQKIKQTMIVQTDMSLHQAHILSYRMCSAILPFIIQLETCTVQWTFSNFNNNVLQILSNFQLCNPQWNKNQTRMFQTFSY